MGQVIAVSVLKGGVAKTATAVNLSCVLAGMGYRTALVDFDPQGDASKCMGINLTELKYSLFDVFLQEKTMKNIVYKAYGVDVYPAKKDLAGLDRLAEENRDVYPDHRIMLRDTLKTIRDKYDYIFIDLPPSRGPLTINGLTAADKVLIPMQCEYLATDGVETMLQEIDQARKSTNPIIELLGVLATMYITGTVLSSDVVQESRKHFFETGVKMFDTVIPRSVRFGDAPRYGKPAIILYPKNDAIRNYVTLAEEIIALEKEIVAL